MTKQREIIWFGGLLSITWRDGTWKQQLLPAESYCLISLFAFKIILLMVRRYKLKQVEQFAPRKKAGECVCPPDGRRCSSSPQNSAAAVVRLASSKQWTAKPTGSRLQSKKADSTKIRLPLKISRDKKWQLERKQFQNMWIYSQFCFNSEQWA